MVSIQRSMTKHLCDRKIQNGRQIHESRLSIRIRKVDQHKIAHGHAWYEYNVPKIQNGHQI